MLRGVEFLISHVISEICLVGPHLPATRGWVNDVNKTRLSWLQGKFCYSRVSCLWISSKFATDHVWGRTAATCECVLNSCGNFIRLPELKSTHEKIKTWGTQYSCCYIMLNKGVLSLFLMYYANKMFDYELCDERKRHVSGVPEEHCENFRIVT